MRAIRFPFNVDRGGNIEQARSYEDIVRGQVIDALMTNQGERVMRPRYGCDVQAALFDPQDELIRRDAASMLKARLTQFVTRAIIRDVDITLDKEPGVVLITITYRVSLYATDTTLTFPTSAEYVSRQLETTLGGT